MATNPTTLDLTDVVFENEHEEIAEALAIMLVQEQGMDGAISSLTQIIAIMAENNPSSRELMKKAYSFQTAYLNQQKKQ